MSKPTQDGGPAFPVEVQWHDKDICSGVQTGSRSGWEIGMTLRDYFAAMALQGIIAHPDIPEYPQHEAAMLAYDYADAMLAARSK